MQINIYHNIIKKSEKIITTEGIRMIYNRKMMVEPTIKINISKKPFSPILFYRGYVI